jgi:hypothetical protein
MWLYWRVSKSTWLISLSWQNQITIFPTETAHVLPSYSSLVLMVMTAASVSGWTRSEATLGRRAMLLSFARGRRIPAENHTGQASHVIIPAILKTWRSRSS